MKKMRNQYLNNEYIIRGNNHEENNWKRHQSWRKKLITRKEPRAKIDAPKAVREAKADYSSS
jgi:hypothetical protein